MRVAQLVFGFLLLPLAAGVAFAQPQGAGGGVLEEIVVTAQKREQSIQDVGISITAFTGAQLDALGIEQSFDAAAFTPGVHISGNLAGQNTQFTIRGVTQNDFNDIIEAPNAVYLDEGYFAVAQAQTFAVFDVERVEILKGPQGTLFGRNATGGLVHYQSNKPNFEAPEGYLDVTFGEFDSNANAFQTRLEGAAGVPLSEKLAARIAFLYNEHDGYLNNRYDEGYGFDPATAPFTSSPGAGAGADMGDDDTIAYRVMFDYAASEDVLFRVSFNHAQSKIATGPYQSKSTIAVLRKVEDAIGPGEDAYELVNVIDTPADESRLSIIEGTDMDGGADFIDGDGNYVPNDFQYNGFFATGFDPDPPSTTDPATVPDADRSSRPCDGCDFFGYKDPDGDDFDTSGDFAFDNHGRTKTAGLNGRMEWTLTDGIELTAVTDFKEYEKILFIDVDSAPVNQLGNYAGVDSTSFTQEIRLNGDTDNANWVAGVFYLNIDTDSDNGLKAPTGSIVAGAFGPTDIGVVSTLETDSWSLYGQFEYDFSETVTGIIGARIIREDKDYQTEIGFYGASAADVSQVNVGDPFPNAPVPGAPFREQLETSDTLWAGKLQLDYHASDDLLIYAGLNRGVKAGSFNAPLLGSYLGGGGAFPMDTNAAPGPNNPFVVNPNSVLPYDEEILHSAEVGFKYTLFGGHTRLNGTAFYYDYQDYQAFLFVGVGGLVINADTQTFGAEVDVQSSPIEGLDLIFSVGWFDATVKDVPLRSGSPLPARDVAPTYAPELQVTALARYEFPLFGGLANVRGDVSYSGEYYYNLRNFDADKFDAYVMVNFGIGWTTSDERWGVDLKVNNLTDERVGVQGFDLATLCGCNEVAYQPPTWYGVSARYSF